MISRRAFLIGSLAPLLARGLPAFAQNSCGAEGEIVALADYVLANRSKLPKLQNRRNGAVSAYLKIHYQALAPEQVEATVAPLALAQVDGARELLDSWRISIKGLAAMLEETPEAEKSLVTPGAGMSVLRAAALSGEIPFLFEKLAAIPEQTRQRVETELVQSLVDLDDESGRAIAEEARSRDLLLTAGGLIATHADLAAWQSFIAGVADKGRAERLTDQLHWYPSLRGLPGYPRWKRSDAQGELMRVLMQQLAIAGTRTPEREFLNAYLNYSGDYAAVAAAANAVNELTRDGVPVEMETIWLVAFQTLSETAAKKDSVDTALTGISFAGTRFGGSNVREALDTMLAVEAFKGAASGTGTAPDMVDGASKDFVVQLPAWQEASQAIGAGGDLAAFRSSGQRLSIVANLLFANGRYADAAKFLISTVPNSDSIRLAEVYAEALDRRCRGHLAFPGEALTLKGTPLFRFDPQT